MASRSARARARRKPCTLISELYSAASEWSLIIVLLVNAVLAYFATKFAKLMNLKVPCLLCSRLDHILGKDQKGFYRILLCNGHKVEISELIYCEEHRKLGNVKEMCEACLLSSLSHKKNDPEAYRSLIEKLGLLVGKLGLHLVEGHEIKDDLSKEPLLSKDIEPERREVCSCCKKTITKKPFSSLLLQSNECKAEILSREQKSEGLGKKKKGRSSVSKMDSNQLSHVGYRKLKVASDTESELPCSDEDNNSTAGFRVVEGVKEPSARRAPKVPVSSKTNKGNVLPVTVEEKMIHPDSVVHDNSKEEAQKSKIKSAKESKKHSTAEPTNKIGHGLEEINWNQIDVPNKTTSSSESTSQQVQPQVSNDQPETIIVGEVLCAPTSLNLDVTKVSPPTNQVATEPSQPVRRIMERNDSLKGSFPCKGSPRFSEILASKESSRVHEDLKMRLTQRSPLRVVETISNDIIGSPKQWSEMKSDASSSTGIQNVTKRLSCERNNSGIESGEGSLFPELDAELSVERLRQQMELDRKSMTGLYRELEEERSASAVAVNEAMAMINRLQEEKASMQMEALQYLRMMEEQSEYDQEAIQRLNDQLTEREKELLDLESELENYRMRYGEESIEEKVIEPLKASEIIRTNSISSNMLKKSLSRSKSEKFDMMYNSTGSFKMRDPFFDFKQEKAYIEEYLKSLQQKLDASTTNEFCVDDDAKQKDKIDLIEEDTLSSEVEVNSNQPESSNLDHASVNGSSLSPKQPNQSVVQEKHETSDNGKHHRNGSCKKGDTISLQDEVSRLSDRLDAFEADRKFLEMTISTLRSGDDGLRFLQDIASQLRELRILQAAQEE